MYRKRVRCVHSTAGRNDGALGKFALNAAGLRSRCLGPSALKWLAVGPSEAEGRIRVAPLPAVNIHVSPLPPMRYGCVVPGPRAVKTHTRRDEIGISDLGLCVMASSTDGAPRFILS